MIFYTLVSCHSFKLLSKWHRGESGWRKKLQSVTWGRGLKKYHFPSDVADEHMPVLRFLLARHLYFKRKLSFSKLYASSFKIHMRHQTLENLVELVSKSVNGLTMVPRVVWTWVKYIVPYEIRNPLIKFF